MDTDRALGEWKVINSDKKSIDRFIGTHEFTLEGVTAKRVVVPYSLWMYQRVLDFYHSLDEDKTQVKDLLDRIGIHDELEKGTENRVMRENNILVNA